MKKLLSAVLLVLAAAIFAADPVIPPPSDAMRLVSRIPHPDGFAFILVPENFRLIPELAALRDNFLREIRKSNGEGMAIFTIPKNIPLEDIQTIVGATVETRRGDEEEGEFTLLLKFSRPAAGMILDLFAQGKIAPVPQGDKVKRIDGVPVSVWKDENTSLLFAAQEPDELQIRFGTLKRKADRPLKSVPGRANIFARHREKIEGKNLLGMLIVDNFEPLSHVDDFENISSICAWGFSEKPGALSLRVAVLCCEEKKAPETAKKLLSDIMKDMKDDEKALFAKVRTTVKRNDILYSLDLTPDESAALIRKLREDLSPSPERFQDEVPCCEDDAAGANLPPDIKDDQKKVDGNKL